MYFKFYGEFYILVVNGFNWRSFKALHFKSLKINGKHETEKAQEVE